MDRNKAIQSVNEIKELMERSSKFVSLSGLTGILVGLYSLVGSYLAVNIVGVRMEHVYTLILLGTGVLIASVATAFFVSLYKSKKSRQKLFNRLTYRIVWNFSIPLLAGGLLCIALLLRKDYDLVSTIMLLFYGLSLVNVSKYTFSNVAWLGYAFLVLGILDSFIPGYEWLWWTLGFGVFHLIYGVLFYFLYEKDS